MDHCLFADLSTYNSRLTLHYTQDLIKSLLDSNVTWAVIGKAQLP